MLSYERRKIKTEKENDFDMSKTKLVTFNHHRAGHEFFSSHGERSMVLLPWNFNLYLLQTLGRKIKKPQKGEYLNERGDVLIKTYNQRRFT